MTAIEWTDVTWNPVTGCTRVSSGCARCYAEVVHTRRHLAWKAGTWDKAPKQYHTPFSTVLCHPDRLEKPLRWRKPRMVFVNSVSDLFHEDVPDEFIGRVFAVMAKARQHTYQILTKRPGRMYKLLGPDSKIRCHFGRNVWCEVHPEILHPNVWLGVSVEDQATADERIPLLLDTPAALRFVSYEPALGPVDFGPFVWQSCSVCATCFPCDCGLNDSPWAKLDWLIVGGESGAGARPFDAQYARDTITQCEAAGVPCFVKQLGAKPFEWETVPSKISKYGWGKREAPLNLASSKGGDMSEWPEDLRVRQFPTRQAATISGEGP